ncbi:la-related protein 6C [Cocos nucifera]|uniref:La-related protein 6C n=1 Tax=Cocos nucifera TaxID=13894 RepID=A0A8K0ID45_COCNU|nr:la-related protein 6C [Cocos nucifera]
MAQENKEGEVNGSTKGAEANETMGFKFNVHAPEFVPRSYSQASPISGYFYPYLQFFGNGEGGLGPDWIYFAEQEPSHFVPEVHSKISGHSKNNNDVIQKIVKQVEYQFSDTNLVASDFLIKIMNKDPEGYVPMSVIASWKKIKSLGANNQMLIKALRTSTKLVVSEDGKKVRRRQPFTERDKEELQSRTVIVENLPEDYSRQNLEKIFSVAGSVKNIRICHPQEPNSARSSKTDVLISNKPRSVIRTRRSDYDHFDIVSEDEQSPPSQTVGSLHIEQILEHNIEDNQNTTKKGWGRGRAKLHGMVQNHNGRGLLSQTPQPGYLGQSEALSKQMLQGPRMPDGTRGFTMGRGKPLTPVLGASPLTPTGSGPVEL